jgi:hypothetical protein
MGTVEREPKQATGLGGDFNKERDLTMIENDVNLSKADLLGSERFKSGIVKCRLIHLDGKSVVQPDVLLSSDFRGRKFYIPQFFDPNQIGFFDERENNFCRFTVVTENHIVLRIGFFARDRIKTCTDGSVIYRCYFSRVSGNVSPKPSGIWRELGGNYQLKLFHHTNEAGYTGITASSEIWGSRRNIQGNLWLNNIAYGYFTSLYRIRNENDLGAIAMSSSGLTGLIPTNAPYHPMYATMVPIPKQTAADRARTLALWVDCELLAPCHLWKHRPMDSPAYYEVVLPKVFRVGIKPGENLRIVAGEVQAAEPSRQFFRYVIVGDGDTHEGLQAPFHEEETTQVAVVEQLQEDQEIIECWRRLANTNQFDNRVLEYAELKAVSPPE